jgi:eukaryotic-like serine/threonine-protein kinase
MSSHQPLQSSESSEEARAFLQSRVALFWKVMFFIILLSSGLGAIGTIAKPGVDLVLTLVVTAQAGALWWLCSRGKRSIGFSRWAEGGSLLINLAGGALLSRYLLKGFVHDRSLVEPESIILADGYLAMMQLSGTAMMLAIRAALIPSAPRRTIAVTAIVGIPMIVVSTIIVPTAEGGLAWRAAHSSAYPWLPVNACMMWGYVIITCAVISRVIYGLRAQVRDARRLGQYVLERKIGEGGMGEVYQARHGLMRRPTALKLLRADRAGEGNLRRFEREVQLTARLTHPNTITIFDYGRTNDGVFYYAMELLDGANLQRIVATCGAQTPGRVVRILGMACRALTEAHGVGLIHRDIKPANIMLCTQGGECDVVKLLDFGLVKQLRVDGEAELTGANTVLGTPQYMAPEAILTPDASDARSDIYALGAVAYYLLAGGDVFEGQSLLEICFQHLHAPPEALAARGVTTCPELEAVVLACLHKQPESRPQSADELRRLVEACPVEPWSDEQAQRWWLEHRAGLERDQPVTSSRPQTVAVDGTPRRLLEL